MTLRFFRNKMTAPHMQKLLDLLGSASPVMLFLDSSKKFKKAQQMPVEKWDPLPPKHKQKIKDLIALKNTERFDDNANRRAKNITQMCNMASTVFFVVRFTNRATLLSNTSFAHEATGRLNDRYTRGKGQPIHYADVYHGHHSVCCCRSA